jgi:hypothetical protein
MKLTAAITHAQWIRVLGARFCAAVSVTGITLVDRSTAR